jgi:hypothetical protein
MHHQDDPVGAGDLQIRGRYRRAETDAGQNDQSSAYA